MKKLLTFEDFIFESVSKKTVPLFYSERFRSILTKIKSKSRYAQFLLGAEDSNQISDTSTLIDVTDKNDMISFIQLNRILRAEPDTRQMEDGIYFLPRKITNDETNKFWKEGRTEVGIGKWTRRIITEVHKSTVVDSDLEKFVNLYKAAFDGKEIENFEVVKGEEIRKWYLDSNYELIRGQLGNSCMRYPKCQSYLDIYVKNPEVVSMLILKNESGDKITGRALIWKLHKPVGDYTHFMDRIYTIRDSDKILFQEWANEKKIIHSGSIIRNTLWVKLDNGDFDKYPYMDTFICYNSENLLLTNNEDYWPGQGYDKLQNTDGTFETGEQTWSEYYGEYISGDVVWCRNIDSYIYESDAVYLQYKNEWAHIGTDVVYSKNMLEHFYEDDTIYSEVLDDYIWKKSDLLVKLITHETDMPRLHDWTIKSKPETYIESGGKYYSRKNFFKNPFNGSIVHIDNVENVNKQIAKEIFDKDLSSLTKEEIKDKLIEIVKNNKYNREEVIESIQNNLIWRNRIFGVYWGLDKDDPITKDEMIIFLVYFVILGYNKKSKSVRDFLAEIIGNESDWKNLVKTDLTSKIRKIFRIRTEYFSYIYDICQSFDYGSFGDDFYKLYICILTI